MSQPLQSPHSQPSIDSSGESQWGAHTGVEDELVRMRYVRMGLSFAIPMQVAFSIFNFFTGLVIEGFFDVLTTILFGSSLLLLHAKKYIALAYHLIVAGGALIASYTIFFTEHDVFATILGIFPVPLVAFYLLGLKKGVAWVIPASVLPVLVGIFPHWFTPIPPYSGYALHMLGAYFVMAVFVATSEWSRARSWNSLYQADFFLKQATEQHTTLEGLVPICSFCKRTRDDNGYWSNLESFLKENTHAQISTGLCDKCVASNADGPPTGGSVPKENETNYLQTMLNTTEALRRMFVVFGGMSGVLIAGIFVVRYVSRGDFLIAATNFAAGVVALFAVVMVWKKIWVKMVYRLLVAAFWGVMLAPFFKATSEPMEILWFLVFPVVAYHLLGFRSGLVSVLLLAVVTAVILLDFKLLAPLPISTEFKLYFSLAFFFVVLLSSIMERLREQYSLMVEQRIMALHKKYEEIRTLKGIVPVCASCKSVRNEKGFWMDVEKLMIEETDLLFSHSICLPCLRKQFPEIYAEMKQANELDGTASFPLVRD